MRQKKSEKSGSKKNAAGAIKLQLLDRHLVEKAAKTKPFFVLFLLCQDESSSLAMVIQEQYFLFTTWQTI